jgi:hypothetical protein
LAAKLGGTSHEVAAVMRLSRSAGFSVEDAGPITLCLWRPVSGKSLDARPAPADAEVCSTEVAPKR